MFPSSFLLIIFFLHHRKWYRLPNAWHGGRHKNHSVWHAQQFLVYLVVVILLNSGRGGHQSGWSMAKCLASHSALERLEPQLLRGNPKTGQLCLIGPDQVVVCLQSMQKRPRNLQLKKALYPSWFPSIENWGRRALVRGHGPTYLAHSGQFILEISDCTVLGIEHILWKEVWHCTPSLLSRNTCQVSCMLTSSFLVTIVRADGSRLEADNTSFSCASWNRQRYRCWMWAQGITLAM